MRMGNNAPKRFVVVTHSRGSTVVSATSKYGLKQAIRRHPDITEVISQRDATSQEIQTYHQERKAANEAKARS